MANQMMGSMMGAGPAPAAAAPAAAPAVPPPLPQAVQLWVAINGQQTGPCDMATVRTYIQQGTVTRESLAWKQGLPAWVPRHRSRRSRRSSTRCLLRCPRPVDDALHHLAPGRGLWWNAHP